MNVGPGFPMHEHDTILRARVRTRTDRVRHFIVGTTEGESQRTLLPVADEVEIVTEPGGYFLFRYSATGEPLGDTWTATLEEAFAQAEFEFAIQPADWYAAASTTGAAPPVPET